MSIQFPSAESGRRDRRRLTLAIAAAFLASGLLALAVLVWWRVNPGYFKCGHAYCG